MEHTIAFSCCGKICPWLLAKKKMPRLHFKGKGPEGQCRSSSWCPDVSEKTLRFTRRGGECPRLGGKVRKQTGSY